MQKFETSDASHVRLCKMSQFMGKDAELKLPDRATTGIIHSIVEAKHSLGLPTSWIITFTAKSPPIEFVRKKRGSRW